MEKYKITLGGLVIRDARKLLYGRGLFPSYILYFTP